MKKKGKARSLLPFCLPEKQKREEEKDDYYNQSGNERNKSNTKIKPAKPGGGFFGDICIYFINSNK